MSKKFCMLVIGITIIISLLVGGNVFAENNITVQLDGKILNFDVQPQIIGGRTMVPLRTIFESLGATVDWNNDTKTVTAFNELFYVQSTINDNNMKVNGETKILDIPPLLVNGRTLVPARFVAEAFGAEVEWDGENKKVIITTTNNTVATFYIGEYVYKVSPTWKQVEGDNGITYFYPSGTTSSENGMLMVQTEYLEAGNIPLDEIYDAFVGGIKESTTNFRILEQNNTLISNIYSRKIHFSWNINDEVYQSEAIFFIQNDRFYTFMITHQENIPSILISDFNKVVQSINIVKSDTLNVVPKVVEIKSAKELENYLKDNFGELKTEFKTYNLKDYIRVIENEDMYKCYDIAITIPWTLIEFEYYDIRNSIKYTDEQKKALEDSINAYIKSIADAAISAMPTKKIRGGFLEAGYKYPNLKMDYYENTIFGWKNYDYMTRIFPYYEDTKITEFHWHNFSGSGAPFDGI